MQDRVGQQFGSYRLVSLMGQGGFADVYLAQHLYLERQAAIKILQTRLSQQNQEAFLKEARTIADLVHPNIIRVLDFGVEASENIPFLVMEYAPHGSLRQRYPMGSRLHVNEVVEYVKQIASALQYAHERKIVHRDVKPENMLLGQNGNVLLSDFGLAVISQTSRPGTQDIHGTVAYMAPEQLKGRPQTASDQYALAMTAYELLSGDIPFKGSFAEVGSQQLFEPVPSLKDRVPQLPSEVERVILTALSKDPQQRFATVEAFANALVQASVSSGTATASSLSGTMITAMSENAQVPPPPPGYVPNIPIPPPPAGMFGSFDPTTPSVSRNLGQQMTPSQPPMMYGSSDPMAPSGSRNQGQQMTPPQPSMGGYPSYPAQGSNMQNSGGPFGPVYGQMPSGGVPQGQQSPQTIPPANQPSAFSTETIANSSIMSNQSTMSNTIPQSWNPPPNMGTQSPAPSQNTLMDQDRGTPPIPPDKPKKSGGHGGYIAIIVVLLLIILAGGAFAAYAAFLNHPSTASVATATSVVQNPNSTPDLAATTNALNNNATATASASTPTPTVPGASPTPTATPSSASSGTTYDQGINNVILTCIASCDDHITLVVDSVTINTASSSMKWNFTVTNNGSVACTISTTMNLQDPSANTLKPDSGTFTQGNITASTQSLPLLAIFSSIPKSGVTYLMHSSSYCGYNSYEQNQTISFVFHT